LRRGQLSRNLKRLYRTGLSTLLSGQSDENSVFRTIDGIPGLIFLPSGATPPTPAESLGSQRMKQLVGVWRQKFDFVVFDSAPVIPAADATALSQNVDGVVLVVRFAVSTRKPVQRTISILRRARAECLGVVANDVESSSMEYGYYGYYPAHGDKNAENGQDSSGSDWTGVSGGKK